MKRTFLKIFVAASLISGFATFTSCDKDDPKDEPVVVEESEVLKNLKEGVLKGTIEKDFTLDSGKEYRLTGAFIVKEGATLTIPAGTKITATAKGTEVYIAILQGAKINIEGTAGSPVVMSSPKADRGDWGGLTICGKATTTAGVNAEAEIGGFIYGGTDDADSSGSISHLVIKGTGAQINPESQYNGVSLYAVGSGTKINNVAVINGADDGIEFFGGTVSVSNLYLENNEDDSIDWTEGWSGTVKNAFISHTIAGFSTAFEGDKDNNNPKFINVTAISTVGGTALQFKKQSGATITGLSLTGYDKTIDMKNDGPLANVKIDGKDADPTKSYNAPATVKAENFSWIGNISSAATAELKGELTSDLTLNPNTVYNLTGAYIVKDGATLTIPAGTRINADSKGTEVYIAVLMGGKIDIQGTESKPVVMTSDTAKPGDWGGLTLCGKATTTAGVNAEAEVGGFIYGGTDDADNSGSISYLIIKGTGAQINPESQYNGVSLYAVGSGTKIDNVAVINGADDGIEFFGGTVSVSNLYLENNEDDSIDWTEGWSGSVKNAFISHTVAGFSTAFEGDKDNNNPKFINVTAISTVGGTALQFKKQSGATITGLSLTGYDKTIDMKNDGPLANVQIDGKDADPALSYNAPATVDVANFAWIGKTANAATTAELKGELTSDLTLNPNTVYNLTGAYIVKDGATLTIPAGTRINADSKGTEVYIAVLMGGKIDIQGTESKPVVMTSDTAKPGDWGGLTLCGKATTTAGVNAEAEVGGFIYGGTDDADSSGSIKYLVIKGTGAQINPESQYNGVSFYAVGSGTILENIAVINGADDGVEFFGGTASAKNLYLENNEDDSVDWTEGWSGSVDNVYISHTVAGFSTAFEGDKVNNNPKFKNVTAISTVGGTALQFKKQSGATITNLYLEGYEKNIDMKNDGPLANVQIEGKDATVGGVYQTGKLDISTWKWFK